MLCVLVAPHFVLRPADISMPEDSTAVFQCDAMGEPTPLISWYKNSEYDTQQFYTAQSAAHQFLNIFYNVFVFGKICIQSVPVPIRFLWNISSWHVLRNVIWLRVVFIDIAL